MPLRKLNDGEGGQISLPVILITLMKIKEPKKVSMKRGSKSCRPEGRSIPSKRTAVAKSLDQDDDFARGKAKPMLINSACGANGRGEQHRTAGRGESRQRT